MNDSVPAAAGSVLSTIPEDLVEQLARRTHEHYLEDRRADGTLDPTRPTHAPWDELPAETKFQNCDQVRNIPIKLAASGYEVVVVGPDIDVVEELPDDVLQRLAEWEHTRWLTGQRDDTHRDYVHWADLDGAAREKDYKPIQRIPQELGSVGLGCRPAQP